MDADALLERIGEVSPGIEARGFLNDRGLKK